jgi:hypothetical protein
MTFRHFKDADDVLSYVFSELIQSLECDLIRMEQDDWQSYTDFDRQEMRNKIADVRAIESKTTVMP